MSAKIKQPLFQAVVYFVLVLLSEAAFNELDKSFNGKLLIGAVSDNTNGGAAYDAQRKHAQKALSVYSALFLLNPDRRFVFICFLDKKGCGSCMKTY